MTRWIKIPGPGQDRGQGEWRRISILGPNSGPSFEEWQYCRDTGYLPTHEGDEPPAEEVRDGK